jgi:TonB family protein
MMNDLLSRLDKYKYGMFFMVAFFIIFSSIRVKYGFVDRPDISHLLNQKPDDVIELKLEPLELVELRMNATGEVKNATHDENSDGSSSSSSSNSSDYKSYYGSAKSLNDVEQSVYDLEKSMFEEAGGAATRAEIQKGMEQRQKEQQDANKNKSNSTSSSTQKSAGDSNKGKVLVRYNVANRTGQNVPAPGYMCPQGTSGEIVINIKVDPSGKVIEAKVNPSSATNECMIHHALEFAKKSKFNYTSTSSSAQEGTITYTFVN